MVSTILLLLFSPLIIFFQICILIFNGRPTIFVQKRPGFKNKLFNIYKLRTMSNNKDLSGNLLSDKDRTTSLGSFLRKTSIDELPSLWNVLKGDMSLVGPRPLLIEYLPLYTKRQAKRHDIKPGITGWAQINGRNNIPWEKKFNDDIWYLENRSFFLDIKILFITIIKVFKSDGINQSKFNTMKKFKGSR